MTKALVLGTPVPGDPSGTALAIGMLNVDVDRVLRPGLRAVEATIPTLAAKAREVVAEIDSHKNPGAGTAMRFVRVDREVSVEDLRRGKLKVRGCDTSKIMVLTAALLSQGAGRARELLHIFLGAVMKGGIPVKLDEKPQIEGAVSIRVFNESIEIRRALLN